MYSNSDLLQEDIIPNFPNLHPSEKGIKIKVLWIIFLSKMVKAKNIRTLNSKFSTLLLSVDFCSLTSSSNLSQLSSVSLEEAGDILRSLSFKSTKSPPGSL